MICIDDPEALDEAAVILDREAARLRRRHPIAADDRALRASRLRRRAADIRGQRDAAARVD